VDATDVDLRALLGECVRTVEPLVRPGQVEIDWTVAEGAQSLHTDPEKMRQVVLNLLGNAVKFTGRGSVRVEARATGESGLTIAVSDTGIGIAPEKLDLVFEEFSQADASATREHGGTGLGLAIARHLARLLGGDITVESTIGVGSTFTVTLPLRYESPARAPER